jgi:TRAP-type C4-dicarboxylate transport system permease small subunit
MKLRRIIDATLRNFLIFLMIILVIDVLWQVFSRYIIGVPSSFTDELAGFLLIWVGLGGAAYATGNKLHLAIDLFPSKLPPDKRKYLEIFINILIIAFALTVMVVGGTWLVLTRFYLGQISSALQISIGYVYLILPISGLLICYYSVDDILLLLNLRKNEITK